MLLQLRDYAKSGRVEGMAPTGYKETPIRYAIYLDETGRFLDCVDQAQGGKGREKRGKLTIAPHVGRAYAIRPKLLADNAEYALGVARDVAKQVRVDESHQAFIELTRICAEETGESAVGVVLAFLEAGANTDARLPTDFDAGAVVTFKVGDVWPIDLPSVWAFWANRSGPQENDGDLESGNTPAGTMMQCLVCGEMRPAVQRLAYKWQGIPGGQSAGLALISANAPAFESYGLEASLIAPTCAECGELFSKAANDLLANDATRVRIGPLAYIFWTREDIGFNLGTLLTDPTTEQMQAFYNSPFSGQGGAANIDDSPFYAAAFSASGARVVVRDWLDTTVSTVRQPLLRYFRLQGVVDRFGAAVPPLGIRSLAGGTVRDPMKDQAPVQVSRMLLSVALNGGVVPRHLLYEAVRRCRAGSGVSRAQAALIKMVLLSEREQGEGSDNMAEQELVQLDIQKRTPAYLCGRLLAVLEDAQQAALGHDVNATIVDRYFGTASSAPAAVFGKLLRGAQPHLGKLRRERRGTYERLQQRLEQVQEGLITFPKVLTLQEQGLFALGYYHQRAADRADRTTRAAAARAKQSERTTADQDQDTDTETE